MKIIITWMLASAIGIGVLGQATPTEANLLKQLRKNFLRGNGDGGDAAAAAIEAHDRLLQEATSSMSMMISDIDNIALPSLLPTTDEITELVDDMKAEDIDISLSTAMTIMASSSDNLPAYHHGLDSFCEWFITKMTYHLPLPHTHKHVEDGTGGKNCPYLMGKLCDVKPTPKPSTSTTTLKPTDNQSSNPTNNPSSNPTFNPTEQPTENPTHSPSLTPTHTPTHTPTLFPTANPSSSPVEKCPADRTACSSCVGFTCTDESDCCATSSAAGGGQENCWTAFICVDSKLNGLYNTTVPILDCTKTCTDSTRFEDCAGLGIESANIGCAMFSTGPSLCTVESRNNTGTCLGFTG